MGSGYPRPLLDALDERCEGYCEACGFPLRPGSLTEGVARHHRLLRSHGGSDTLVNLMTVHHACHNVAAGSIHQNPARSERLFHILPAGTDPETAPAPVAVRNLRALRA